MRKPISEVILMVTPVSLSAANEPASENGIVVMTMNENLGDSNCAAITTNTRNTAIAIAL